MTPENPTPNLLANFSPEAQQSLLTRWAAAESAVQPSPLRQELEVSPDPMIFTRGDESFTNLSDVGLVYSHFLRSNWFTSAPMRAKLAFGKATTPSDPNFNATDWIYQNNYLQEMTDRQRRKFLNGEYEDIGSYDELMLEFGSDLLLGDAERKIGEASFGANLLAGLPAGFTDPINYATAGYLGIGTATARAIARPTLGSAASALFRQGVAGVTAEVANEAMIAGTSDYYEYAMGYEQILQSFVYNAVLGTALDSVGPLAGYSKLADPDVSFPESPAGRHARKAVGTIYDEVHKLGDLFATREREGATAETQPSAAPEAPSIAPEAPEAITPPQSPPAPESPQTVSKAVFALHNAPDDLVGEVVQSLGTRDTHIDLLLGMVEDLEDNVQPKIDTDVDATLGAARKISEQLFTFNDDFKSYVITPNLGNAEKLTLSIGKLFESQRLWNSLGLDYAALRNASKEGKSLLDPLEMDQAIATFQMIEGEITEALNHVAKYLKIDIENPPFEVGALPSADAFTRAVSGHDPTYETIQGLPPAEVLELRRAIVETERARRPNIPDPMPDAMRSQAQKMVNDAAVSHYLFTNLFQSFPEQVRNNAPAPLRNLLVLHEDFLRRIGHLAQDIRDLALDKENIKSSQSAFRDHFNAIDAMVENLRQNKLDKLESILTDDVINYVQSLSDPVDRRTMNGLIHSLHGDILIMMDHVGQLVRNYNLQPPDKLAALIMGEVPESGLIREAPEAPPAQPPATPPPAPPGQQPTAPSPTEPLSFDDTAPVTPKDLERPWLSEKVANTFVGLANTMDGISEAITGKAITPVVSLVYSNNPITRLFTTMFFETNTPTKGVMNPKKNYFRGQPLESHLEALHRSKQHVNDAYRTVLEELAMMTMRSKELTPLRPRDYRANLELALDMALGHSLEFIETVDFKIDRFIESLDYVFTTRQQFPPLTAAQKTQLKPHLRQLFDADIRYRSHVLKATPMPGPAQSQSVRSHYKLHPRIANTGDVSILDQVIRMSEDNLGYTYSRRGGLLGFVDQTGFTDANGNPDIPAITKYLNEKHEGIWLTADDMAILMEDTPNFALIEELGMTYDFQQRMHHQAEGLMKEYLLDYLTQADRYITEMYRNSDSSKLPPLESIRPTTALVVDGTRLTYDDFRQQLRTAIDEQHDAYQAYKDLENDVTGDSAQRRIAWLHYQTLLRRNRKYFDALRSIDVAELVDQVQTILEAFNESPGALDIAPADVGVQRRIARWRRDKQRMENAITQDFMKNLRQLTNLENPLATENPTVTGLTQSLINLTGMTRLGRSMTATLNEWFQGSTQRIARNGFATIVDKNALKFVANEFAKLTEAERLEIAEAIDLAQDFQAGKIDKLTEAQHDQLLRAGKKNRAAAEADQIRLWTEMVPGGSRNQAPRAYTQYGIDYEPANLDRMDGFMRWIVDQSNLGIQFTTGSMRPRSSIGRFFYKPIKATSLQKGTEWQRLFSFYHMHKFMMNKFADLANLDTLMREHSLADVRTQLGIDQGDIALIRQWLSTEHLQTLAKMAEDPKNYIEAHGTKWWKGEWASLSPAEAQALRAYSGFLDNIARKDMSMEPGILDRPMIARRNVGRLLHQFMTPVTTLLTQLTRKSGLRSAPRNVMLFVNLMAAGTFMMFLRDLLRYDDTEEVLDHWAYRMNPQEGLGGTMFDALMYSGYFGLGEKLLQPARALFSDNYYEQANAFEWNFSPPSIGLLQDLWKAGPYAITQMAQGEDIPESVKRSWRNLAVLPNLLATDAAGRLFSYAAEQGWLEPIGIDDDRKDDLLETLTNPPPKRIKEEQ